MNLTLRWAGCSETGPVREGNEDSAYAGPRLALIADGVGGMIAGEVASSVALGVMRRLDADAADDVLDALSTALTAANARLRDAVAVDPGLEGMGTTLTALLSNGTQLGLAHVGDSRAYLLREGRLHQVSTDHTFVQTLVDEGRITAEEARTHPHKSLILQALDGRTRIDPDLTRLDLTAGDRFLLCSDGLSDVLHDAELAGGLGVADPQDAADGLVAAALQGGATDNVTCLVVDAVEADRAVGAPAADPIVLGAAANPQVAALVERLTAGVRDAASGREHPAGAAGAPVGAPVAGASVGGAAGSRSGPPADPEELRYAPREPRRFRWVARSLVAAGVLALVALGGDAAYAWTQGQYFVTDHEGRVAIYQGIPQRVPGIELAHLYRVSEDLPVDALPDFFRRKVVDDAVTADSLDQAQAIVANLAGLAVRCGPAPVGTPTGAPAPTAPATTPAAPPPPIPTPTLTPTPTPTPTGVAGECTGGTDLESPGAGATAGTTAAPRPPGSPGTGQPAAPGTGQPAAPGTGQPVPAGPGRTTTPAGTGRTTTPAGTAPAAQPNPTALNPSSAATGGAAAASPRATPRPPTAPATAEPTTPAPSAVPTGPAADPELSALPATRQPTATTAPGRGPR